MKIGITCHPSTGGSGILATELGMALADKGHTVHFVSPEVPFRLEEFRTNVFCHVAQTASYPLFQTPPSSLALAAKIAEVADETPVDVWHAHYAIPNAVSAILARDMLPPEKRFKVVTTLHGTDITLVGSDPSFYRITRYAIQGSDAVTAVSHWLRDETIREFEIERPIETIHNFVNLERFRPGPHPGCDLAHGDEKIIMHISNFRPVKRVTDIVRAFKKIVERIDARLVMIGDGPERMASIRVAKQLGIEDLVTYMGNHERIEALIPCANLVFQPSEHESFGLVPLEAMACGVPVLGTTSGGVCEVVEDGVTGFLCEVGDTSAMAERALEILENDGKAQQMGRAGRRRAEELFCQARIVQQYEKIYNDLMG